jgi:hypothetical protein
VDVDDPALASRGFLRNGLAALKQRARAKSGEPGEEVPARSETVMGRLHGRKL